MDLLFLVGQANQDGVIFDLDRVGLDILASWPTQNLAGAHVELRAMPGAGQDVTLQISLVEWAADVGAIIGEGVDATLDFGQANQFAIGLYGERSTLFYLISVGNFEKFGHAFPLIEQRLLM